MNLFKALVESAPVKARLDFGINENVIVKAVDTSVRKNKGLPIKANTYIALAKVDPETRKVVATTECSFFNLNPEKGKEDMVINNFIGQFTCLAAIIEAVGEDAGAFEEKVMNVCPEDVEVDDYVITKDGAKALQDVMQDAFGEMMTDKVGDKSPLLKCKMIVNKKGYQEFPKELGWILPMDSEDEIAEVTAYENKLYTESLSEKDAPKQAKPDSVGKKPEGEGEEKAEGDAPSGEKQVAKKSGFRGL